MKDVCPHRLAPLSEGRIDSSTGCIECPYHGWQFAASGKCTKIPQMPSNPEAKSKSIGIDAHSLPVYITGDLIWAFVPLPPGQASHFSTMPDEIFPELHSMPSIVARDLPYSFDILVENFMDPAHIPFAHHSLQAPLTDRAGPWPVGWRRGRPYLHLN